MTTLAHEYDYVARADRALDREHPEFDELRRLYDDGMKGGEADWSTLPVKSGERPTVWRMKHVIGRAREHIRGAFSERFSTERFSNEVLYLAAQYGVVGAKDARKRDGQPLEFRFVPCRRTDVAMLSDETMAEIEDNFGADVMYELGGLAMGAALRVRPL